MGRFKNGLLAGGLVGAAMMWLNTTTKGKKYRNQMLDQAADIYNEVKERVMESEKWDTLTKTKFAKYVDEAVEKYARDNAMADNVKRMVVRLVKSQWKVVQDEMKRMKK